MAASGLMGPIDVQELCDALQQTIEQVRSTIRTTPPSAAGPYAQLVRQALTLIGLADRLTQVVQNQRGLHDVTGSTTPSNATQDARGSTATNSSSSSDTGTGHGSKGAAEKQLDHRQKVLALQPAGQQPQAVIVALESQLQAERAHAASLQQQLDSLTRDFGSKAAQLQDSCRTKIEELKRAHQAALQDAMKQQQDTAPRQQQQQQAARQKHSVQVQCELLTQQQIAADADELLRTMEQQLVQLSSRLRV